MTNIPEPFAPQDPQPQQPVDAVGSTRLDNYLDRVARSIIPTQPIEPGKFLNPKFSVSELSYGSMLQDRTLPSPDQNSPVFAAAADFEQRRRKAAYEQAREVFSLSLQKSPKERARAQQIAQEIGTTPEAVENDPKVFEEHLRRMEFDRQELAQVAPATAGAYQDLRWANIAHDQVENISAWEEFTHSITYGQMSVERGELATAVMSGTASPWQKKRLAQIDYQMKTAPMQSGWIADTGMLIGQSYETGADALILGGTLAVVGATAGFFLGPPGAAAAGASLGFKTGATWAGVKGSYQTLAGNSFQDMVNSGIDPESAKYGARGYAVLGTIPEILGFGATTPIFRNAMLRAIGPEIARKIGMEATNNAFQVATKKGIAVATAKGLAIGTGAELAVEESQLIFETIATEIAKAYSSPEFQEAIKQGEIGEAGFWQEFWDTAAQTARGSLGLGVLLSPIDVGYHSYHYKQSVASATMARALVAHSEKIAELDARDPTLTSAKLQQVSGAAGAERVLIEAGVLRKRLEELTALGKSKQKGAAAELTPYDAFDDFRRAFPELADQLDKITDPRQDVEIPIGLFMARVGKTGFGNALQDDLRIVTRSNPVWLVEFYEFGRVDVRGSSRRVGDVHIHVLAVPK